MARALYIFLLLPLLLVFKNDCKSQSSVNVKTGSDKVKKIQIKGGSLEHDASLGINAKRLLGNVIFEHEGVVMYCDSAYLYEGDSLDAFSNIRIQQADTLNLYGDFLKYNGKTKKALIKNHVRLQDKEMTLTTDFLTYDMKAGIATYLNGGKIVSKDNTLTSKIGYYNSRSKEFTFKKNVVLVNPQYVMNCDTLLYNTFSKIAYFHGPTTIKASDNLIYCENGWYDTSNDLSQFSRNAYIITNLQTLKGDSLYYDRKKGLGRAFRNITISDTIQNILISGNYAEHYEHEDKSIVTDHAILMQVYNNDTLFLHADTLKAIATKKDSKDESKILFAYHHVKFYKNDLQGKCDSLVYTYGDSTMNLYKDPILWSDENQLTAENVMIKTGKGKISYLEMNTNAFIVSMEDTAMFNQIKGKKMKGFFSNNDLTRIFVEGNGQTIYYAKDKEKPVGVNKAVCSDIILYMKDNKVETITFLTQPDATLNPLGELKREELELEGFKWKASERPQNKNEIF